MTPDRDLVRALALLAVSALCAVAVPPARAAAAAPANSEGPQLAALLHDVAPAVVTVKVVVKTTRESGGRSDERESRFEIPGVVVDGGGLIMTSLFPFAPERMLGMLMPGFRGVDFKTVPSEIEVIFEQDDREHPAFLAATHSSLGLAFIQVEDLEGPPAKRIDFTHPGTAAVGDLIVMISRLGKEYDSAPIFETARLSGQITKPRRAWALDRDLQTLGLPVYSSAGKVLGILGIVESGTAAEEASGAAPPRAIQMLTSGQAPFRFFVVPAPAIASVIEQARQQAAQKTAERAAAAAKKAAPPSPSPPPPPPPPR